MTPITEHPQDIRYTFLACHHAFSYQLFHQKEHVVTLNAIAPKENHWHPDEEQFINSTAAHTGYACNSFCKHRQTASRESFHPFPYLKTTRKNNPLHSIKRDTYHTRKNNPLYSIKRDTYPIPLEGVAIALDGLVILAIGAL